VKLLLLSSSAISRFGLKNELCFLAEKPPSSKP